MGSMLSLGLQLQKPTGVSPARPILAPLLG